MSLPVPRFSRGVFFRRLLAWCVGGVFGVAGVGGEDGAGGRPDLPWLAGYVADDAGDEVFRRDAADYLAELQRQVEAIREVKTGLSLKADADAFYRAVNPKKDKIKAAAFGPLAAALLPSLTVETSFVERASQYALLADAAVRETGEKQTRALAELLDVMAWDAAHKAPGPGQPGPGDPRYHFFQVFKKTYAPGPYPEALREKLVATNRRGLWLPIDVVVSADLRELAPQLRELYAQAVNDPEERARAAKPADAQRGEAPYTPGYPFMHALACLGDEEMITRLRERFAVLAKIDADVKGGDVPNTIGDAMADLVRTKNEECVRAAAIWLVHNKRPANTFFWNLAPFSDYYPEAPRFDLGNRKYPREMQEWLRVNVLKEAPTP